ncbi:MAG: AI-2E family transporter [Candidatus Niyogibacteria bacterium]|nr:AI-2E family transporter [Candidatus Niyogibacteria bacterium]
MFNGGKGEKHTIEITTGTVVRAILLVVLVIFLYRIRNVVAIILVSVVIASALEQLSRWFIRNRVPRVLGIIAVYLITFLVLSSLFYIIVPPLFAEMSDFAVQLPAYLQANISNPYVAQFLPDMPPSTLDYVSNTIINFKSSFEGAAGGFFGAISYVFGGALSLVLIIVISFYLAVQERGIEDFLHIIAPPEYEVYLLDLWARSSHKIGKWLQGQILLGILVGVLVFLGLTILQVRYALSLAMLSAVFELIPMFGPVLAAIPAIAIAFIQKPILGLIVLGFYIIVQQFENHLIYPLVVRKTIGVNPIMVVLSLLIGNEIAGFFGFILAVPVAAILVEIATDITKHKQLIAGVDE